MPLHLQQGTADTSSMARALAYSVKVRERDSMLSAQVGNLILTHEMKESHPGMACVLGLVHSMSKGPWKP